MEPPLRRPAGEGRNAGRPMRLTVAESMRDVFDIYTIIFLALAVFIFLRLRSVLGQRTGRERPPFNPYAAREARPAAPAEKSEKVVSLPSRFTTTATARPGFTRLAARSRFLGV